MKIFLGADHQGFDLKEFLKEKLKEEDFDFEDCGNFVYDPNDDYSDIALLVAEKVKNNPESFGILICGSGAGVCFTANKVKGIRAGLATIPEMAQAIRADDDVNILCLASKFTSRENAWQIVQVFLSTPFKNEKKYLRRIQKVQDYENKNYSSN